MGIRLEGLSAKELEALIAQASRRKKQLAKRKPVAVVRQKLAALAKAEGYTLAEIMAAPAVPARKAAVTGAAKKPARVSGAKGMKVAPKYRNPADPSQTWAGRGQQPKWLAAEIARGKVLADFAV